MIIGFIIWTIVSVIMLIIGIVTWRSKKAVGFFTGVTPPEVTDVKKYNHTVAVLWIVYGVLLELCGIPFLYLKQNDAGFILPMCIAVALSLALVIVYVFIEKKYRFRRKK